jgi:hypothetical protein
VEEAESRCQQLMKSYLALGIAVVLGGCAYGTPAGQIAPGSEVGGTGDIKYSQENLGNGTHLVTVRVAPGMLETEDSMSQRMFVFENKFAAQTCRGRFEFIADPNRERRIDELTVRVKPYVFRCT